MAREPDSTSNTLISSTTSITGYPFTISWWYFLTARGGNGCHVSICDSTSNTTRNGIIHFSGGGHGEFIDNANRTTIAGGAVEGEWRHFAWSCTGSASRFMNLNGTRTDGTGDFALGGTIDRFSVGIFCDSTPDTPLNANNYIAEFAMWNVALTEDECDRLFLSKLSPLLIRPQSLVTYCPLNDGAGNARDIVGGHDLAEAGTVNLVANPPGIIYKPKIFAFPKLTVAAPAARRIFTFAH